MHRALASAVYTIALALLTSETGAAAPRNAHLGKHIKDMPPVSRIARKLTNGSSIPAGGAVWPTAIYWAMVQVGTPPQSYPACIDSGSGDLDIGAVGCAGCVTKPPNRGYDEGASSTSKPVFPFTFKNTYETCDLKHPTAPCSISGKVYSDQVSMAGFGPVSVKIGAIEKQDANFDQFSEIDGVVGFTAGGSEDVFSSLVKAGQCENMWAICMSAGSHSNGTLTLGGVDTRLAAGPIRYVDDSPGGFHTVNVASILLNGSSHSAGASIKVGALAILDTGTNILLLPDKLLATFHSTMCQDSSLAKCEALWGNACVSLTDEEVDAYPALEIQLDGTSLHMSARDYLLLGSPLATAAGQYCLGIRSGGDLFIIGDTTMRHYYLVFDSVRGKIGWADVNKGPGGCGSIEEGEVAVL
jgi:hypothetical protein